MTVKMEFCQNQTEDSCEMKISGEMTIYTISEIKQQLDTELNAFNRIELNLQTVEEIDSSGIQLLAALKQELDNRGKSFYLTETSESVNQLLSTYDLDPVFFTAVPNE